MDGGLYERDFYTWTQEQAAALRRLSERRVNLEPDLDLPNLIEEMDGLGRSEVSAARSHLHQVLKHVLLVASAPDDLSVNHWCGEIVTLRRNAAERFLESMRQVVEPSLDREWRAARRAVAAKLGRPLPGLADACPFTLDELLDEDGDLGRLVARIRPLTA